MSKLNLKDVKIEMPKDFIGNPKDIEVMKTIDEIKKEVAKECAEEHFEVIFDAEISVGGYEQARRLWNEVGDRYIKQFENKG